MFHVMVVRLSGRMQHAAGVQEVLTKHGCSIKTRLGLHEAGGVCANDGLMILQLTDDDAENKALDAELNAIEGVTAKMLSL